MWGGILSMSNKFQLTSQMLICVCLVWPLWQAAQWWFRGPVKSVWLKQTFQVSWEIWDYPSIVSVCTLWTKSLFPIYYTWKYRRKTPFLLCSFRFSSSLPCFGRASPGTSCQNKLDRLMRFLTLHNPPDTPFTALKSLNNLSFTWLEFAPMTVGDVHLTASIWNIWNVGNDCDWLLLTDGSCRLRFLWRNLGYVDFPQRDGQQFEIQLCIFKWRQTALCPTVTPVSVQRI